MSENYYIMCLVGKKDPIALFTAPDLESAILEKYNSLQAISREDNILKTPLLSYEIKDAKTAFKTKLRLYRYIRDMDVYTLHKKTGISIHMIEHYEALHLDLRKARAITVYKLSQALGCEIEDLIE